MNKLIFVVEIKAIQPLMLRTEGIYDVATRLVDSKEVPSIITRKLTRPLRDTLRSYARDTGDPWINQVCLYKFPTETMCCWCIDCLLFGGTNAKANTIKELNINGQKQKFKFNTRMVQLRHLVSPVDALAVTGDEHVPVESETHIGVKEGRVAEIGQALYAPSQIPPGTRFIGTIMVDLDAATVTEATLIQVLATIFLHTRKYGARTAEVGLVEPKILAVVKAPYEFLTSYDLYTVVKPAKDAEWKPKIKQHLKEHKNSIPELDIFPEDTYKPLIKEKLVSGDNSALAQLTRELRRSLEQEGVRVEEVT